MIQRKNTETKNFSQQVSKRWFVLFLGAALLAVSMIMNIFFSRELIRIYRELQRVNLDPSSQWLYQRFSVEDEYEKKEFRMVLFGDSRVQGWNPSPHLKGFQVINRGVSGETTSRALLRIRRDVLDLTPDIVVIQMGVNDLKSIGVFPNQERQIISQCQSNIQTMIDTLARAGIHPVVLTILPTGRISIFRRLIWSPRIDMAIDEVNGWLRTLGNANVTVIDCDSLLKEGQEIQTELFADTLHLNEQGYQRLNEGLQLAIEKILIQSVQ